jgi:hypothetical protein
MTFVMGPALLFCPADRPERFQKAAERSDAVILDLEDAVAAPDKQRARGAILAAETGFGYGDTEVVAYSERLLQLFAENLATRAMTPAQALMFAQQSYVGELGVMGVYDAKVLGITTFYGLPMWRLGADGGEAESAMPPAPTGGRTLASAPFSVTPELTEVASDLGRYWVADGELPQVSHFRPIQPRLSVDVTNSDGLPVHGAIIGRMTLSTPEMPKKP